MASSPCGHSRLAFPLTSSPGFLLSPPSPQDMAVLPLNLRVFHGKQGLRRKQQARVSLRPQVQP